MTDGGLQTSNSEQRARGKAFLNRSVTPCARREESHENEVCCTSRFIVLSDRTATEHYKPVIQSRALTKPALVSKNLIVMEGVVQSGYN